MSFNFSLSGNRNKLQQQQQPSENYENKKRKKKKKKEERTQSVLLMYSLHCDIVSHDSIRGLNLVHRRRSLACVFLVRLSLLLVLFFESFLHFYVEV